MFISAAALLALLGGLSNGSATSSAWSRQGTPIEYLMVPSPSMNRQVKVEYQGGGSRAVYLLDGMLARDDFNGWDIHLPVFEWFGQSGLAVVMPTGRHGELLLQLVPPCGRQERDIHLQVGNVPHRGAAGLVGGEQGDQRVRQRRGGRVDVRVGRSGPGRQSSAELLYAASMSGFLNLSAGNWPSLVSAAQLGAGGFRSDAMWGPPGDPAWAANDPTVNVPKLVANNTRIWVYTGNGGNSDLGTKLDASLLESATRISNKVFQARYQAKGGHNAVFNFPANGTHTWSYWGEQLQAMLPDLQQVLGAA